MTHKILLSSGIFPWMNVTQIEAFSRSCGFDGIELVPTRRIVHQIAVLQQKYPQTWLHYLKNVFGLHHSWRLDIGQDAGYGISKTTSFFFTLIRILFFPSVANSKKVLTSLSDELSVPVTVHGVSGIWVNGVNKKEYMGGILYEIIGEKGLPLDQLKSWLKQKNHSVIFDTRDDQSIAYAKHHGFSDWKMFWHDIGLQNVKNIQITLIGRHTLKDIFAHKKTLIEEELSWLHQKQWHGTVTVEINPIALLLERKKIKQPLQELVRFVIETLDEGKSWSL